jgi:hypothetical protein
MFAVGGPSAYAAAAAAAAAATDAHGAATCAAKNAKVAADHDYAIAAAFHAETASRADVDAADAATDAATAAARGDSTAAANAAYTAAAAATTAIGAAAKAAKAAGAVRSEEWHRFLQSRSVIGMHTIIWMHTDNSWWAQLWMSYLLALVLVAQVILPILLLLNSSETFKPAQFCDKNASWIARAVALAIACIYQVRISLWWGSKYREPTVERKQVARNYFWLGFALFLDGFMASGYEYLVFYINLFVVFVTTDPQEMVLNALAFEFIRELDDFAKEKYISIFAEDHEELIQKYEATFEFTNKNPEKIHWYCTLLRYATSHVLPSFCIIYFPLCKSKGRCELPCAFDDS